MGKGCLARLAVSVKRLDQEGSGFLHDAEMGLNGCSFYVGRERFLCMGV